MSTWYDRNENGTYAILTGEHEADIGHLGLAYDESTARKFSAVDELLTDLRDLVYLLAGDQHDEQTIDTAFNLRGLGYRLGLARKHIREAEEAL